MKIIGNLILIFLVFGSFQGLFTVNTSETLQISYIHEEPTVETTEMSNTEEKSVLLSGEWQFILQTNGAAKVQLEMELYWTGKPEYIELELPKTMEVQNKERYRIESLPSNGKSYDIVKIFPDIPVNSTRTIDIEFSWPMAAYFYYDNWYFPAFEKLQLFPDRDYFTIKKLIAVVKLPEGTREDSIDVKQIRGFKNETEGTIVTLTVDINKTGPSKMPPIRFSGPPKPMGQSIELMNHEFSINIPSFFESTATEVFSKIQNISDIIKEWLDRPEHQNKVSIIFIPQFEEMSNNISRDRSLNNEFIIIQGTDIYSLIEPLQNKLVAPEGLQKLIKSITLSYIPQRNFPDFFLKGLPELGNYYCLNQLGANYSVNELSKEHIEPENVDIRLWSWQWSSKAKILQLIDLPTFDQQAFYILNNLSLHNSTQIFQKFLKKLEDDHIRFTNELTWADRWRLFIYYLEKTELIVNLDLITFFQQWGLQLNVCKTKFVHSYYWIWNLFLGSIIFAYIGGQWKNSQWSLLKKGVSIGLGILFASYLILPYRFQWINNPRFLDVVLILYHSFLGTLLTFLFLCIPASFVIGQFFSKCIKNYRKNNTKEGLL